jgi:glycosyltransferase involved in cell wall biosynthesis
VNILFLGKRFYTNKDALSERFGRIFHLPMEWSNAGNDVRLWLVDYHTREALDTRAGQLSIWSSPAASLRSVACLFRSLRRRPEVLVASGDCYIGLLGWLIARATRARFVFDVYDKYDAFAGYVRPLGWDLFGFLRRHADLLLFSSAPLARSLGQDPDAGGATLVPNGVDEAAFRPMPRAVCRNELGLDADAVLIGYFGGMEPDRGVADLILAIERLREAGSPARLLVCGKEHSSTPLDRDWIVHRGMVPHADMPKYVNAADVVAIPYRLSPFMDMGSSCKIAEYLMCQRPIVSTRTPNFVGNFPLQARQLGDGLCTPEDVPDLARAIDFQLREHVVVNAVPDLAWPGIAAHALSAIRASRDRAAPAGSRAGGAR